MQYKGERTADDRKKCEMFNHFFASVLTQNHQITQDSEVDAAQLNALKISHKDVESVLTSLDVPKDKGPDNIGKIILKNLPCMSKFLMLIFQTCLNKGKYTVVQEISTAVQEMRFESNFSGRR